ncbi:hypothetical protein [Shewanella psychropiezotolerans]|uniref:hypothetical protein n=1 Tax=Shewanella psychropiezotolerans TaxID=2593655 RepID=UPI00163D7B41|nr:hypothetical protein [Shewanella psychropiezotolerans]
MFWQTLSHAVSAGGQSFEELKYQARFSDPRFTIHMGDMAAIFILIGITAQDQKFNRNVLLGVVLYGFVDLTESAFADFFNEGIISGVETPLFRRLASVRDFHSLFS